MKEVDKILEGMNKLGMEYSWYEKTTKSELIFVRVAEPLTMNVMNNLIQVCQSNNLVFEITLGEEHIIFIVIREKEQ